MPFITALLGFLFLKEKISTNVWIAIIIATIGIFIMAIGDFEKGSLFGLTFGLISALGFSVFSVSLRWRKETPKFTTVALQEYFVPFFISCNNRNSIKFFIIKFNQGLFSVHGTLVCLGLILYSIGSKNYTSSRTNTFIFNRGNRWNILGLVTNTWNK